jgi:hypothetical protein
MNDPFEDSHLEQLNPFEHLYYDEKPLGFFASLFKTIRRYFERKKQDDFNDPDWKDRISTSSGEEENIKKLINNSFGQNSEEDVLESSVKENN